MMQETLTGHLLKCFAAYVKATGESESTVARLAAQADYGFFKRLRPANDNRKSRTFTVKKYDEVIGWFSANWPAKTPWPASVPRPKKRAA